MWFPGPAYILRLLETELNCTDLEDRCGTSAACRALFLSEPCFRLRVSSLSFRALKVLWCLFCVQRFTKNTWFLLFIGLFAAQMSVNGPYITEMPANGYFEGWSSSVSDIAETTNIVAYCLLATWALKILNEFTAQESGLQNKVRKSFWLTGHSFD